MAAKRKPGRPSKRTKEREELICRVIGRGLSLDTAADIAGIGRETLRRWRNEDPDGFGADVRAAIAGGKDRVASKLMEQIENGSVPAMQFWLVRRTEEFREPKEQPITFALPEGTSLDLGAIAAQMIRAGLSQGSSPAAIKTGVDTLLAAANTADKSEIARQVRELADQIEQMGK